MEHFTMELVTMCFGAEINEETRLMFARTIHARQRRNVVPSLRYLAIQSHQQQWILANREAFHQSLAHHEFTAVPWLRTTSNSEFFSFVLQEASFASQRIQLCVYPNLVQLRDRSNGRERLMVTYANSERETRMDEAVNWSLDILRVNAVGIYVADDVSWFRRFGHILDDEVHMRAPEYVRRIPEVPNEQFHVFHHQGF